MPQSANAAHGLQCQLDWLATPKTLVPAHLLTAVCASSTLIVIDEVASSQERASLKPIHQRQLRERSDGPAANLLLGQYLV
jgi:hypothetical protein